MSFHFRLLFAVINATQYFAIQNYSVEQIVSLSASGFWDVQEMYHILWNTKVHYGLHKRSTIVLTLSQLNTLHTNSFYL